MQNFGLTHVYYGDGKGKTTAALGLAMRACGSGARVVFMQFLKNARTGELVSLGTLGIKVLRGRSGGERNISTEPTDAETRAIHDANLTEAAKLVFGGVCDMLVLDEGLDALRHELVDEELFYRILNERPKNVELVITGHKPVERVLEAADYVSHIAAEKHPFDRGVPAREGIEF